MATTALTGRTIHDFSGDVLLVPSGGLPKGAPTGALVLENETLHIRVGGQWNKLTMTPIPEEPVVVVPDAAVAGAGSIGCNGNYVNETQDEWRKPNSAFSISRVVGYPTPGEPAWVIQRDGQVFYTAPDGPTPWNKIWSTGSFGALPVPTVLEV